MWYTSNLINTPLWGQCRVRHRKAVKAKTNKSSNPYRRVVHPSIWHSCVWQRKLTNPLTIVWSFAVVRGWWSAIVLSFAVVRGWWPAIVLSHLPPKPNFTVQNERFARFYHLPWSGVGGLLLSYHLLWRGWSWATKNKFHSLKHRDNTQKENAEKTHTENTERENTQTENAERKHRKKTQRKHTDKKTHR